MSKKEQTMVDLPDDAALRALGIDPGLDQGLPDPDQPVKREAQSQVQLVATDEPQTQQSEGGVAEEGQQENLTLEERARRWQSNYSKEQAERKRLETELEEARRESEVMRTIALQQRRLDQMAGTYTPQPAQPKSDGLKKPLITDYITDYDGGYIDPSDPRYISYESAREEYLISIAEHRATESIRRQTEESRKQQLVQRRAQKLCEKYPEFVDPFTKQPDYAKIQDWLNSIGSDGEEDWVLMREYMDYRSGKAVASPHPTGNSSDIARQLDRAASMPSSVVASPPATTTTIRISEEDAEMMKVYGPYWRSMK